MMRVITRLFVLALCLVSALGAAAIIATPKAAAAPCADVEVVFARGTIEPAPPVGLTGLSFDAALRSRLPASR